MADTIFDKILAGEIPAEKIYEDDHVLAFRDVNPQAPIHVLVIPKIKMESFTQIKDASPEETGQFFNKVSFVASKLGLDGDGYRVIINAGKHGQQSVEYLHAHIMGGRQLNWPPG